MALYLAFLLVSLHSRKSSILLLELPSSQFSLIRSLSWLKAPDSALAFVTGTEPLPFTVTSSCASHAVDSKLLLNKWIWFQPPLELHLPVTCPSPRPCYCVFTFSPFPKCLKLFNYFLLLLFSSVFLIKFHLELMFSWAPYNLLLSSEEDMVLSVCFDLFVVFNQLSLHFFVLWCCPFLFLIFVFLILGSFFLILQNACVRIFNSVWSVVLEFLFSFMVSWQGEFPAAVWFCSDVFLLLGMSGVLFLV